MVQGTTARGFEYVIPDSRLDDFEIVEALMEADDAPGVIKVARMILGFEQYSRLKEHTRENGKISTEAMFSEISDILHGCNQLKN